jgi:hypothetical protein
VLAPAILARFAIALDLHACDGKVLLRADNENVAQNPLPVLIGYLKRRRRPPRLWKPSFDEQKSVDHHKISACHADRQQGQARAAGHPHSRSQPYCGCGRQTANEVLPNKDYAAADEPDARDNLRGYSLRIENDTAIGEDIGEAIFRNEDDQRGGEAHQGVGPQPCALLSNFALKADERRQNQREGQLRELEPPLANRFSEKHTSHHSVRSLNQPLIEFRPGLALSFHEQRKNFDLATHLNAVLVEQLVVFE